MRPREARHLELLANGVDERFEAGCVQFLFFDERCQSRQKEFEHVRFFVEKKAVEVVSIDVPEETGDGFVDPACGLPVK